MSTANSGLDAPSKACWKMCFVRPKSHLLYQGTSLNRCVLHKPHVATHSRLDFIRSNIEGTQVLLDAALREGVESFVFTSTTSTFGDALAPPPGAPAAWITEEVAPQVKNIYGASKLAAKRNV